MSLLDKVSQVTQTHASGKKAPVQVADKLVKRTTNVLDSIDDKESTLNRVADHKVKTRVKTRVVVMDSDRVKQIMAMGRSQRRAEIKRMSDNERRKFLHLYKRVKDAQNDPDKWKVASAIIQSAIQGLTPWDVAKTSLEYIEFDDERINEFVDDNIAKEATEEGMAEVVKAFAEKSIDLEKPAPEDFEETLKNWGSEDMDEDTEKEVEKEGEDIADTVSTMTFDQLEYVIDTAIAKYVNKGYDYDAVRDSLSKGFGRAVSDRTQRAIMDNVVDEIAESLEEPTKEVSLLEIFAKAVEDYASGDSGPLQELVDKTIIVEETESEEPEVEPEENLEENTEEPEAETEENTEETDDSGEFEEITLEDSAKFAKSILEGTISRKIYDKLAQKVPALKKVLLRASDHHLAQCPHTEATVVQVPMTCEDFQSIWEMPHYLPEVAKSDIQCPDVTSCDVHNGCIVVNPDTMPQTWLPIIGTPEEVLSSDMNQLKKNIQDKCVLVEDVLKYASKTNQLAVIDHKFYKTRLSDECWHYDTRPECLSEKAPMSGTVVPIWVEIPAEVPHCSELIYGQQYNIL